jgi:hypothetical protein
MVLRFVILVAALATSAYCIDFEEAALSSKHACEELSSQDCFTYHEAFEDKCKDYCDPIRKGQGTPAPSGGTTAPPEDDNSKKDGKKKKGKGGACFHGDDSVVTNYGPMKMSDLVGRDDIQVLTRTADQRLELSTVYSWLHADPNVKTDFIVFTTESGHKLPITGAHLIYETDCNGNSQAIFAKRVQVGKCLFVNDNGEFKESKIVEKTTEMKTGIYAPITENGNIVVNDVLASCVTNYENEALMNIIYSFVHQTRRVLRNVMPTVMFETLFGSAGAVPHGVITFMDLSKPFTKY